MALAPDAKKKLPGMMIMSASTFIACLAAAFPEVISFDLMLDLNAMSGDGFPWTYPLNLKSMVGESYQWSFPAFVGGECAAMGLCAGILDRYGRRTPYLIGSLMFVISTALSAVATDMLFFNLVRVVQGFGTGMIIVTCVAQVFFDVKDPGSRYLGNGIMSLGFGAGMVFGIFIGQLAVNSIGWRSMLWIMMVAQIVVMYPCFRIMSHGDVSDRKADLAGGVVLMVLAAALVYGLEVIYLNWSVTSAGSMACLAAVVFLAVLFVTVEVLNPDSMAHRRLNGKNLFIGSMIMILMLGALDMASVAWMVKVALFTYRMPVIEVIPHFLVLILGAVVTAVCASKTIRRLGHRFWFLLSGVLALVALSSVLLIDSNSPTYTFALHNFLIGLAIGCLVSLLNATIQNRTDKDTNGAYMSFALMARTTALWVGYNIYQKFADVVMEPQLKPTTDYWSNVLGVAIPSDTSIANLLITPFSDVLYMVPGLVDKISQTFVNGIGCGFATMGVVFLVITIPVTYFLVDKEKVL